MAFRNSVAGGAVAFATPTGAVHIGDAAVAGPGPAAASSQHVHGFPAPAAGYVTDVASLLIDGALSAPARADHAHRHRVVDHAFGGIADLTAAFQRRAVFDVTEARFGAVGDGVTNDTAAIQAAFTAAVAVRGVVLFPPTAAFYLTTGGITVAGDVSVYAYGATIQIQGYIFNNTPINLRWFGGTITDVAGTTYPFQFGAGALAQGVGSSRLISCVARDIVFSGVHNGGWLCNALDGTGANFNTDVYWDNVRCIKAATAGANDGFQLVGDRVFVRATIDDGGTTGFGITSAWLKRAYWNVTAIGAGPRKIVALQPYTGNGPAPYFDNLTIEAHGGQIVLNNGNLAVAQTVATDTRIICDNVEWLQIGNTAFDGWGHVSALGTIRLTNTHALDVINCTSFEGDLVIDGSGATGSNRQLIALGNAPASLCAQVKFKRLVVRNVAGASYTNVLGALPSASCTQLSIMSGDITDGVTAAFFPTADVPQFGTFVVRDVLGAETAPFQSRPANPTGTTSATPVMMGLALPFTPRRSGSLLVVIDGNLYNGTVGAAMTAKLKHGTGAAPANGAADTGTQDSGNPTMTNPNINVGVPFSLQAVVSGLTLGTAVWFDLAVSTASGTAIPQNLSVSIVEL